MRVIANEIVKPMERGQITIPVAIRKKLGITPQSWLWVKLIDNAKILIEPVEERMSKASFLSFLSQIGSDSKVYWQKKDDLALQKVRKKSSQRIKKLCQ